MGPILSKREMTFHGEAILKAIPQVQLCLRLYLRCTTYNERCTCTLRCTKEGKGKGEMQKEKGPTVAKPRRAERWPKIEGNQAGHPINYPNYTAHHGKVTQRTSVAASQALGPAPGNGHDDAIGLGRMKTGANDALARPKRLQVKFLVCAADQDADKLRFCTAVPMKTHGL